MGSVPMTVGNSDQHIEVKTEGLVLQTEDSSFKQTIDQQTITEMPLNGRQMTGLIGLSGGSTPAPGNTTQWKHQLVFGGRVLAQRD
jgi:hypothetical protein